MGAQLGQKLNINENQVTSDNNSDDPSVRIKKLKSMLEEGLITEEQFNQKRDEILKDI